MKRLGLHVNPPNHAPAVASHNMSSNSRDSTFCSIIVALNDFYVAMNDIFYRSSPVCYTFAAENPIK